MTYSFSQASMLDMAHKGVRVSAVHLLLLAGDREIHLHNGCRVLALSREKAQALRAMGFSDAIVSRAMGISLVVNEITDNIVTVLKGALDSHRRPRAGRHRRGGKRASRWVR